MYFIFLTEFGTKQQDAEMIKVMILNYQNSI